ncbi:hypothetical protein [Patulibacter sp.]|uniref:hypothetical protein n=1 Tax=Patulibacter sp. TaxID=1912859 RepID=UPI002728D14F|nr:hypothetical protein [Patulibacter sp.]MDO9407953.1 hypothetical protein [Patulibacter sp.]
MGVGDGGTSSGAPGISFVPAADDGRPVAPVLGATTTPWVLDLIRRFRAAGPTMRVCPHLVEDPHQGAVWLSSVPDLRSCRRTACTEAVLAVLQDRLGHPPAGEPTRCTTCGRVGLPVRGVGVAVGPTMLRGTVCEDCLAALPIPTPSSATDPLAVVAGGTRRPLEPEDEVLGVDPEDLQQLTATDGRIPLDAVGRRALRRGWLLAEACGKATAPGLDPDRAVVGGLLVRAAKLARGLAGPAPADGAFVHEVAFRSLVETTTTLWWLLRADAAAAAPAAAAFRDDGVAGATAFRDDGAAERGPGEVRGRPVLPGPDEPRDRPTVTGTGSRSGSRSVRSLLADLGREADHATLLGPASDAAPGSWPELRALHLSERPDGFALDLGPPVAGPLRALIAGEHLSLACADYVDRMPTDLDRDHLRRLADEVTELRADVERRIAEASPGADG